MRTIYDAETHAWLVEVIKDYRLLGLPVGFLMQYGPYDVSDRLENGDWGSGGDSYSWDLSANVWGAFPARRTRNAPVKLWANFGGFLMRVFEGPTSWPTPTEDYSTEVLAATPGSLSDKITLGEWVGYRGRTPRWCYLDALHRNPLYDRARLEIPNITTPLVYRLQDAGDAFADSDTPASIMSFIEELTGTIGFDTPIDNGHALYLDVGTGENQPVAWTYDASDEREVLERFVEPTPAAPDEQYRRVIVRDRFDSGEYRIYETFDVDYSMWDYPPVAGQDLYIDFSGADLPADDPEADTANAAFRRAHKEAQILSNFLHAGSATVAFNPLLEPQDVVAFESRYEDETGYYRRVWRSVIEGISHAFDEATLETNLDFRCVLVEEARLPDPPIVLRGVSPSVVSFADVGVLVRENERTVTIDDSADWAINQDRTVLLLDHAPITDNGRTVTINR
jgi:hypothetical protein